MPSSPVSSRVCSRNLAVGGYDTLQEIAVLERHGLKYKPNLVVVAYCLNDIGISSVNLEYIERLIERQASPPSRSRLVQFVQHQIDRVEIKSWSRHVNSPEMFQSVYAQRIDPISDDDVELVALMERAGASKARVRSRSGTC